MTVFTRLLERLQADRSSAQDWYDFHTKEAAQYAERVKEFDREIKILSQIESDLK